MKRLSIYLISLLLSIGNIYAQQADSLFAYNDSLRMIKRPWRAAFQSVGINVGVWAFDCYAMNEKYARISFHSIRRNINNGLVWDNDSFSTNLLAHPYNGSLYFSTARANGFNFWESVPYSIAGSVMWEMCAETEPPAINDLLSTSIAGVALGEVSYRLSSLVLDDSKQGANRFFREFVGTLISPVRGINRLFTGDAWKVRHKYNMYHDYNKYPVKFSATIGNRYMVDDNRFFRDSNSPYLEFNVLYGDPLKENTHYPFDYFSLNSVFNLGGNQPVVGSINLLAKLYGKYLEPIPEHKMLIGLFQHFDFYDSGLLIDGSKNIPFKISEAVAFGVGMIYQFPTTNKVKIRQSSFFNGILLGGNLTDYYKWIDRNYNMGSGYSIKNYTSIDFGKYGNFELNLQHYRIFTWVGYENKNIAGIDSLYLNVQGDKGSAWLTVINPKMGINLNPNLLMTAGLYYYLRNSYYAYYRKNVFYRTFEVRFGLRYSF